MVQYSYGLSVFLMGAVFLLGFFGLSLGWRSTTAAPSCPSHRTLTNK